MIDLSKLQVVTNPNLFTDNTYERYEEDGLLSQRIFGPVRNYKCACGNLSSKTEHANMRCPKCHVLCASNEVRYKTFGKIVLPFPVYKPTFKNKLRLRQIVGKKMKHILDPKQSDLSQTTSNYLKYDGSKDQLTVVKEYHAHNTIPLCITGTYTFYLAILAAWKLYGSTKAKHIIQDIFTYQLLVTPPSTRQFFIRDKEGSRQMTTHKINDKYIEILKLCSYDWTHIMDPERNENTYLNMIQETVGNPVAILDEELKYYDQLICKYQYYTNEIYQMITDSLSGKEGFIRKDFLGRSIDFSSRAHIVVDPSLEAHEVKIPKNNFMRLWFIEYMKFIRDVKGEEFDDLRIFVKQTESKITERFPHYVDEFIEYAFSEQMDYRNKIVLINRQPTLWRYGIPAVRVVGVSEGNVIQVSPLLIECMNGDFDGDTMAIYRIHDIDAQTELEEKAYIMNNPVYDHNPSYVQQIRIEPVYAAYSMLSAKVDSNTEPFEIEKLAHLPEVFEYLFNVELPIKIGNDIYSYGVCLFNKWAGFKTVKMASFSGSNDISDAIYKDSKNNREYQNRLSILARKLFWYASVNFQSPLTLSIEEITSLNFNEQKALLSKLPRNPHIGQHIYKGLIGRIYNDIPDSHFFSKLINAKLGKVGTQLARMIGAIGYIANDANIIDSNPLVDSVLNGLAPDPFFRTATGARKGLVDKSRATPESGYLERSLVLNLSPIELGSNDCQTSIGFNITIQNKAHAKSLVNRYYNRNGMWYLFREQDIEKSIGKEFLFRSPITCQEPGFKICRKCFGEYPVKTPFVGILSGQYISERMTQLSMRTFHTSGSSQLKTKPELEMFIFDHLVNLGYVDETRSFTQFDVQIPNDVIEIASQLPGYDGHDDNHLYFQDIYGVQNEDVTQVIKDTHSLLKLESGSSIASIQDTYHQYVVKVLDVGQIYSSFIELVLCNMYICGDNQVLRYALKDDINAVPNRKLNVKKLHTVVSKLLGLLYEPNAFSICKFSDKSDPLPETSDTILERLWGDLL